MAQALALLARGCSQMTIGRELGLSQPATCRLLRKARARLLPLLADGTSGLKVDQDLQLQYIAEECIASWIRSKTPRKRAASKTATGDDGAQGDEVRTTEVVERDGDPQYLTVAMAALRDRRMLWGLDVLAALQDGPTTIAQMSAGLFARAVEYERERRQDGPDGGDEGAG